MATRSAIGIQTGDTIRGVYCHWDGYTEHNGVIISTFYNTREQAEALIELGDISSLGAGLGEKHDFNARTPNEDYIKVESFTFVNPSTTFYGRDRGENKVQYKVYKSRAEFVQAFRGNWCEYFYWLDLDDRWWVKSYSNPWRLLDKELDRLRKEIVKEQV